MSKRKPFEKTDEQKTNKKTYFQHFMLNIFSVRVILNYADVSLLANHDIFVKDIPLIYLGKSIEKLYLTLFIMAFKIYLPFLNGLNFPANYSQPTSIDQNWKIFRYLPIVIRLTSIVLISKEKGTHRRRVKRRCSGSAVLTVKRLRKWRRISHVHVG